MQKNLPLIKLLRNHQPGKPQKNLLSGKLVPFSIALFSFFFSLQAAAQTSVTIGATSGTGSTYFGPVYNFGGSSTTDNSRHAYLYTAAELGIPAGAQITEIAWLKADTGEVSGNNSFNILLKTTTAATLTSGSTWATLTTGATSVYGSTTQTITGGANTYLAFPITPFTYTGNNLQLMVSWVRESNPGEEVTFYPNPATGMAIGAASTATQSNTTTLSTTTYGNSRPTIRIIYSVANDAGITAITSPAATVTPGVSQPVTVSLKNFGTNTLTSATINWSVNGVAQTPFSWTGNLASQQTATGIVVGNFTFPAGGHMLTASTSNPNNGTGGADVITSNDATTLQVGACSGTALAGNYTINSAAATSGTNFQSFTDAASALNGCGIIAPVTLTVAAGSGPYTEQFNLISIPGLSATNTVTFEGNGRTITATPTAANPAIIKLDNADYIRINNLIVTVNAAATVGWGVQLINGSDFAVISNCSINVPLVTGTNLNGIVAGTAPNVAGNNTNNSVFSNNVITGGAYGISINGTTTNLASNNQITGNTVKDADVIHIYLNNTNNTLVEGNDVSRPTRTTTANFQGIYMFGTNQNNVISKNRIHTSGALATAAYGINFRNGTAPAGAENLVKNNLIYNFQNTGATYGIVNVGNSGVNYFHNTIYFSKPNQTTNSVVQGVHQNELASNIHFRNNIIVIDVPGTSTGGKHAFFFNFATSVITSDRNVLYVTPATNNGHIGWHAATNYTTLANWQNANNGAFDQFSISADPLFVNAAAGNLTPTSFAINNLGRPVVPAVTDDFDGGAARSLISPDPGAYEFNVTCTALAGTYTINSAVATGGTNFQTFPAAIQALGSCGISGSVTINVVPGSGPYVGMAEFLPVNGASATSTITINGNGAIVSDSTITNAAVLKLNGIKYLTIDSLTIHVNPTSTSTGGIGIQLVNGADHNVITSNTINLPLTSTNTSLAGILAGPTVTADGNNTNYSVFSNNTINGGYYGIRINGNAGGLNAVGNQIVNNNIRDTYYHNIHVNDADSTLIEGNDISRPTRSGVSTFYGIYLGTDNSAASISRNRIHNTNGGSTFYGIYITGSDAVAGSETIVKNNLMYDITNSGSTYGIYNSSSDGVYYFHNTVDLSNPANTGLVRGFYQTGLASNIKFINNIVTVNSGATGAKHALYFGTTTSTIISNNNVLYVSGGSTSSGIGYYSGNQATLADWKAANSAAYDQNSVSADPLYATVTTGNLTPTNMALNNIGQPTPVTTDINGNPRNATTPDPGAFEFAPAVITPATPTVAANGSTTFCAGGSVMLTATSTTAGVTYQWYNNGTAISGATAATYAATTAGSYTVEAISNSVPSATSAATMVTVNAAPATPIIAAGSATTFCSGGSVTLTGATTTTGATYTWSLNGTVIPGATSATYTANAAGSYTVTATANGCTATSVATTVTVNAKPATPNIFMAGNTLGIIGATGTFQWYSVSGTTLTPIPGATASSFTPTTPGNYTVINTVNGCESDPAVPVQVNFVGIGSLAPGMDVSVYPNPTAGKFAVNLVGFEKEATIQIINVTGQVISSERVAVTSANTSKAFNLGEMAKGVYILKITSGDNLTFRKVILD